MYTEKLNKYRPRRSQIKSVELVEGETIEHKVERLVQNKEPIKDGAPEIFTKRSEGILSAFNIRTDRFEIAADAMDLIQKNKLAKREERGKVITLKKDEEKEEKKDTEGKSTHGQESQGKDNKTE